MSQEERNSIRELVEESEQIRITAQRLNEFVRLDLEAPCKLRVIVGGGFIEEPAI